MAERNSKQRPRSKAAPVGGSARAKVSPEENERERREKRANPERKSELGDPPSSSHGAG